LRDGNTRSGPGCLESASKSPACDRRALWSCQFSDSPALSVARAWTGRLNRRIIRFGRSGRSSLIRRPFAGTGCRRWPADGLCAGCIGRPFVETKAL
jgi:hypothetical protein